MTKKADVLGGKETVFPSREAAEVRTPLQNGTDSGCKNFFSEFPHALW